MRRAGRILTILLGLLVGTASAQSGNPPTSGAGRPNQDAERLRRLAMSFDFANGVEAGERMKARTTSPEVQAWYAYHLARNGRATEAAAIARSLGQRTPGSVWARLASTVAVANGPEQDDQEKVVAAALALGRSRPRHPDAALVAASILAQYLRPHEAIEVLRAQPTRSAEYWATLGDAYWVRSYLRGTEPEHQRWRDSALVLFARGHEADSTNVHAWLSLGSRRGEAGSPADGEAALTRALRLAPQSPQVVEAYAEAVLANRDLRADSVKGELRARIEQMADRWSGDPYVLAWAADQFRGLKLDSLATRTEDRVFSIGPASAGAESVLRSRLRRLGRLAKDTISSTPEIRQRYRSELLDIVRGPTPRSRYLVGDAYARLLAETDSTTPIDTLLAYLHGAEQTWGRLGYQSIEIYASGAVALADRRVHLDEAARLARAGVAAAERDLRRSRDMMEIGDYDAGRNFYLAAMADALGWVHVQAGRTADGQRELRRAMDLQPRYPSTYYHLGRAFEQLGDHDSAEAWFAKGSLVPAVLTQPNRNRAALRELYLAKHGSLAGYDGYVEQLADKDRERRKATVLAEFTKASRTPLPPFRLKRLDGGEVSSAGLQDRVAVINLWGKWCGPCVAETPDIQKVATRYANDTAVVFLTISDDRDLEDLRTWLAQRSFDFPVLIDDGYVARNANGWPTTLFIDRAGRIAVKKFGWSEGLVEEFAWRVEFLKGERP